MRGCHAIDPHCNHCLLLGEHRCHTTEVVTWLGLGLGLGSGSGLGSGWPRSSPAAVALALVQMKDTHAGGSATPSLASSGATWLGLGLG